MKLKLNHRYDYRHPKGFEVEIDKIVFDPEYAGGYKLRVVNIWKKPRYIAISWFLKTPIKSNLYIARDEE